MELDPKKSTGFDGISVKILQNHKKDILPFLVQFINQTFESGVFPDVLKIARVSPLYKAGDSENMNNYRPVSVLPSISKIIEKCMKKQILEFSSNNNLIHAKQFAYLQNKNSFGAIFALIHEINKSIDENQLTACLFIDVQKAFDCMNHEKLFEKLFNIGFKDKSLDLLKSYYKNRKQYASIGGVTSEIADVKAGAAQGSVFGPICFIIYINDILHLKLHGKILMYGCLF